MARFVVFLYIIWIIRTCHHVLLYTYLWQLKEYRMDRMMDLWSTYKGRGYFINLYTGVQILLLLFLWVARYEERLLPYVGWGVAIVFLAESMQAMLTFLGRKLKRPKPTMKAILIMFLTLAVTLTASFFFLQGEIISPDYYRLLLVLLAFSLLLSDINALMVFVFLPLTTRAKKKIYDLAFKKRIARKDLKVVGITGSFGKTTTKEFLNTILSEKFKVLATEGNVNTEIGVAQTLIKKVKDDHEVLVLEMGAYRKGEIRTICEFVRPDIGILTGINEQHVGLFGSLERTMEAKFELIESLPSTGLAVFNGDNEYCLQLAQGVQTPKELYSIEEPMDIWADKIEVRKDEVRFDLHVGDEVRSVRSHITGRHNIQNVLACVSVALELGMTLDEVVAGVKKLSMPTKTMQVFQKGDYVLIDDTYNTNTDGIKSLLQFMHEGYKDYKKIVVFPGILELGKHSQEIHMTMGTEIAKRADYFIISHTDFAKPLMRGARLGGMDADQMFILNNPVQVLGKISGIKGKKVVLFESRGMEAVLKKLQ